MKPDRRATDLWPAVPDALRAFAAALRGFLHGFVGSTALPRDPHGARHALRHEAGGRSRCC